MTFISIPPVHGTALVAAVAAHSQSIRNHPKDAAGAHNPTPKTKFIQRRD
jgi:hypothetical protein